MNVDYIRIDGKKKMAYFDRLVAGTHLEVGHSAHLLIDNEDDEDESVVIHTSPVVHFIQNPDGSMSIETANSIYIRR